MTDHRARSKNLDLLIIADMEGVTGIAQMDACRPGSPSYEEGVELLAREVNALSRAAFEAGATAVHVIDWHAGGGNLHPGLLDEGVALADEDLGCGYGAAVLSGFHPMQGDPRGFISHTMYRGTSVDVESRRVGELWLLSRWAGMHDLPVVLVTGDTAAVEEAKHHLPGTPAVAVKTARSFAEADVLPTEEAHDRMIVALEDALRTPENWQVYHHTGPIHFRLTLDYDAELPRHPRPDLERDEAGRLCGKVSNPHELIKLIDSVAAMRTPR